MTAPLAIPTSSDNSPPCDCRSGLSHARCCGLDLTCIEPASSDAAADRIQLMAASYAADNRELARTVALEILERFPWQRDAMSTLFNIYNRSDGDFGAAAILIGRLTDIYPNDPLFRLVAAQFFIDRHDRASAQLHARMSVRLAPQAPHCHHAMGRAFLMNANPPAAEYHFRRALDLCQASSDPRGKPDIVDLRAHLAVALRDQGRYAEARAMFAELVKNHGDLPAILLVWAALEEAARDFAAAAALLDRADARAPDNPQIILQRADLHRRSREPQKALDVLNGMASAKEPIALLQQGQILDSIGEYDEAFAAFEACKREMRARGQVYAREQAVQLVRRLRDFFTESRAQLLPSAGVRSDIAQPIFILGFPRSGTTLLEQMLSVHPEIAGGDELPIINQLTHRIPMLLGSPGAYPVALSELWLGDRVGYIDTLRDLYLNEAAGMGAILPGKRRFTDKMPLNETHLGLIRLLFPEAPIIHIVRHPLDVVLSVFSNAMTHGYHCANSLETAAEHYALISELIDHYHRVLPVNCHRVRYEDLVADPEPEIRSILATIGEPYVPDVLAFHENKRPARTASYAQVTEKLYQRSRYRYRNYARHLEGVVPVLRPAMERLGYSFQE